ncbi:TPA: ABC transporter substrate-binding protein [Providencia rettgeri]|uniref:HdeA/HdeB family chaperone n=1 Tax=Providencia TaxID=586 RepID=UPI001B396CEA|nr:MULTISPECIES: HdeA/HdeB family chaperone [Providencia]EMB5785898.1 ABC transporter substrate-binding protein [Providencia rettgeri]MBQ0368455.1 ABC transporter substrate-binding protein [Providencia rettgeri]MDK7744305.1 HdeA/HdeB family chaperone [Providencia rettgeri]MDK7757028.1 HdeA/HdeB family chaperone [Providencia rettgeri]HBC7429511.1 ABC transporter substrate-binding protein [Providencia rettgeri]
MRKVIISSVLLAVSTISFNSMAADKNTVTPENMTCQQFINLDPQSWAPIALWVTNQETQFKGGDYVALTEQSIAEAPQIVEFCKKKPEGTLQDYLASKK